MTSTLDVYLEGRPAGTLTRDEGRLAFRYDRDYLLARRSTPLSLSMPLGGRDYGHAVLWPWLWGLLPDNTDVLKRWGSAFGVSAKDPFALLGEVGEDCAGAVQFLPEGVTPASAGRVEWLTDEQVAERLRQLRTDPSSWLVRAGHGRFSLAGAQAKTALHHDPARPSLTWGTASGTRPTTHILKPAVAGFDDHDLNEHLCLELAGALGISAARTRVARFGDERAIVVDRYDRRRAADGAVTRVHQEDLCQALGRHPEAKYQNEGGPSAVDIGKLIRRSAPASGDDLRRFVDALLLTWLIGGTDAHAKNYSLLLSARAVRLAPLYDVSSALPYEALDRHKLRLAMKIGGSYDLDWVGRSDWARLAGELGLGAADVLARGSELARQLPPALRAVCSHEDVAAVGSSMPDRLVEVLSARAARCLRDLTTTVIAGPRGGFDARASGAATVTATLDAIGEAHGGRVWSRSEAVTLLDALRDEDRQLTALVVQAGGSVPAEQLRERLEGDLRGKLTPLTRTLRRLQRSGVLGEDLEPVLESVYGPGTGRRPAVAVQLAATAREAFTQALTQDGASS